MRTVGPDAWIGLSIWQSLFFAALGAVCAVLQRHRLWPLWVAAAWVTTELAFTNWPFSGMPWGRLGFAVVDTPLADALPWIGSTGVSFVLALSGTLLAWIVVARDRERWYAVGALGVAGPAHPGAAAGPVGDDPVERDHRRRHPGRTSPATATTSCTTTGRSPRTRST